MKEISSFELRRIIRKVINECWDDDKKIHSIMNDIIPPRGLSDFGRWYNSASVRLMSGGIYALY